MSIFSISEANGYKITNKKLYMGLKNRLGGQKALEVFFILKLDVLQGVVTDGNFHKNVTDIKALTSDLLEIATNYESKIVEGQA